MLDYHFIEAASCEPFARRDSQSIKNEKIKQRAIVFEKNIARAAMLIHIGPTALLWGFDWLESHNNTFMQMYGTLGPSPEQMKGRKDEGDLKSTVRFFEIQKERLVEPKATESMLLKLSQFQQIIRRTEENGGAVVSAIFNSALTIAWGSLEVLAGDLWEECANAFPMRMLSPESSFTVGLVKAVTGGTFDINLKDRMGDLMREKASFATLDAIRNKYDSAFKDKYQSVARVLDSRSLETINLVRNLIVHKAGVVDEEYFRRAKAYPDLPQLPISTQLEVDGKLLKQLIDPAIMCGFELIKAIDEWMRK